MQMPMINLWLNIWTQSNKLHCEPLEFILTAIVDVHLSLMVCICVIRLARMYIYIWRGPSSGIQDAKIVAHYKAVTSLEHFCVDNVGVQSAMPMAWNASDYALMKIPG